MKPVRDRSVHHPNWTHTTRTYLPDIPEALRLEMLQAPDSWIKEVCGCTHRAVGQYRMRHGIPPATGRGGAPRAGREQWITEWTKRLEAYRRETA